MRARKIAMKPARLNIPNSNVATPVLRKLEIEGPIAVRSLKAKGSRDSGLKGDGHEKVNLIDFEERQSILIYSVTQWLRCPVCSISLAPFSN